LISDHIHSEWNVEKEKVVLISCILRAVTNKKVAECKPRHDLAPSSSVQNKSVGTIYSISDARKKNVYFLMVKE
jgi:hypothetical protein